VEELDGKTGDSMEHVSADQYRRQNGPLQSRRRSSRVRTIPEFIAYAKANPDRPNFSNEHIRAGKLSALGVTTAKRS
jgi:hypothetical protein